MKKPELIAAKKGRNEFSAWLTVMRHFFPDLPEWLNSMADPRNRAYITYEQAVLVMMCIMKNISGLVTMRSMNASFSEEAAILNLSYMAGDETLESMPDWQTANNYLERLGIGELEGIRKKMIWRLLRSKQFDRYKFSGCWTLIIDGTGTAYFKERHCEQDLVMVKKDPGTGKETVMYFHKVLEAKLLLAPGVVVSMDTEFIENEDENVSKQDCEINAAKRMVRRIKGEYPRLPVCLLGDSLYAAMPFMELCSELGWHYIFNLKDGRQKTIADEFRLLVDEKDYRWKAEKLCGKEKGKGAFKNGMGKICGKDLPCNVFEYRRDIEGENGSKEVRFVWITDMELTMDNLKGFIIEARKRWKIENEGFNNQKNGIYEIEHLCSLNPNAMKAHYLITQISDMIMQLYLSFGIYLNAVKRSIKSIARNIGEFFWRIVLTDEDKRSICERRALRLVQEEGT